MKVLEELNHQQIALIKDTVQSAVHNVGDGQFSLYTVNCGGICCTVGITEQALWCGVF